MILASWNSCGVAESLQMIARFRTVSICEKCYGGGGKGSRVEERGVSWKAF